MPRYDNYLRSLSAIVAELKARQIQVAIMTPGCVAPSFQRNGLDGAGYNAALRQLPAQPVGHRRRTESPPDSGGDHDARMRCTILPTQRSGRGRLQCRVK